MSTIITHRQFPNYKEYKMDLCGKPLTLEVGKVCELANAAVVVKYGETTVLCTATAAPRPRDGVDFFPLSVDFEEKLYAVGRIPGSFMRREGRPGLNAVLASRCIDRPIRPLFPSDFRNDVAVVCTVLSVDYDCQPEIAATIGTSAALAISDIPWNGPVGCISVGLVDGEIVLNPDQAQRHKSDMATTVVATGKKVVMIEAGANQVDNETMLKGIKLAFDEIQKQIALINRMVEEIGKPKFDYPHADFDQELFDKIVAETWDEACAAMDTDDKNQREADWNKLIDKWHELFLEEHPNMDQYLDEITYKFQKKIVKKWLLEGHRVDGRQSNEIRPLAAEVGVLPKVHGSGLFTRGQTQVLSVCTLNTLSMCQKIDSIWEEETKRYLHHYNFPGYSVGEARSAKSVGRREYGHGALAERALVPVLPSEEDFPYAIRVVSETLSSNGSTSQGSICGSTLALMDAGVAIQMDLKNDGLTMEIITEALDKTYDARVQILDQIMLPVIAEPRPEISENAPKLIKMKIAVDNIRDVIGSGGKVIQKIQADSGAKVDVEEDGTIYISGPNAATVEAAKKTIDAIVFVPEVGQLYFGKVVRILKFGAFVELAPGKDGMVHISKLANHRIATVKVTDIDEKGRVNLSHIDALREIKAKKQGE